MNSSISQLRQKAYSQLREVLIEGLEKGELTVEEMRSSARFIKYHLEPIESTEELLLFLYELGNKWSTYKKVYVTFLHDEAKSEDLKKMETLQAKLRQLAKSQS